MKKLFLANTVLFSCCFSSIPAFAVSLGVADGYNAFIRGNVTSQNSDIQGRLAAGGNVNLTGYSIGTGLPSDNSGTTNTLVVGNNLSYTNGQVNNGNVIVGGTATTSGFTVANGSLTTGVNTGINFTNEFNSLTNLSHSLANTTSTGTVTYQYGGVYITGDNSNLLQIFNIDGSRLSNANTFNFLNNSTDIPDNATLVFNVSGTSDSMQNFGMDTFKTLLGNSSDNVLFNFFEATSLTLGSIGIKGSILAPLADVIANYGHMDGTIIAASWTGGLELHNVPFESSTPVPEPNTMVLFFSGLIGLASFKSWKDRK
jgi:choice-of-anchor A domain-containing protein